MADEKCFCHFNGFAVKDATARKQIADEVKNRETAIQNEAKARETAIENVKKETAASAETAVIAAESAKQYAMSTGNILPATFELGGLAFADGSELESEREVRTGYIPLFDGAIGIITPNDIQFLIFFYDEDLTLLDYEDIAGGKSEHEKPDAAFVRFAFYGANNLDPEEVSKQVTLYVPKKTFYVYVSEPTGDTYADKNFSDLYAAHEAGITISARTEDGEVLPLVYADREGIVFQSVNGDKYAMVVIKKDNTVKYETGIYANKSDLQFDPTVYGLPILYLEGDTTGISKDNKVSLNYHFDFEPPGNYAGECSLKWQGSSSVNTAISLGKFGKFNYTIEFDEPFDPVDCWGDHKKYCLKANFIDHSHLRNVVCAKLWGEMVKSRATKNEKLTALPNGGAIDGFPVIVMLNGEFHGLYTWNIPKDGWMFGMGEGDTEAIVGADNPLSDDTAFKGETLLDGDGLELEYAPDENDTEWIKTSLNRMINACVNSDGSDLDTVVSQYLDWGSAIDYNLFVVFLGGSDMVTRNYLLATFDGTKWSFSAYDMDSVFGLRWDGKYFFGANAAPTFADFKNKHRAMELIYRFKTDALKARWAQLRNGILSEAHICEVLENFACAIPSVVYLEDVKRWPSIPGSSVNSLDQILRWIHQRLMIVDKWVDALPEQETPGVSTDENLYNGLSDLWGDGYFFSDQATLNIETLELSTAVASTNFCTTKAVAVEPSTEYIIPDIADSSIVTYNASGKYDGTIKATDGDGYQTIATKSTTGYIVFSFYKPTYPDYDNFYIRKKA